MADRTIVTRMRVEYNQAVSGMQAVGSAATHAANRIEGAGKKSDGAFSKMAQQAQQNRQAWETAGTALTVVGGAITGIGVAAGKTGVEYNTLQQTSRAAMKTLMGGAQEANAQMDKLDKFAKTSPFAKQVFIQAQQQLVGFGVEAKKVIPYLSAIQDAVAATGGSNEDISGLVATMSKIQSSAKVTAEDLNEFGNRGVDAAGLIGSQMGKTGAQIREEITKGSLGAEQALDALTQGMSEKFDGAAAGVKETMTGAMDRVKSAWRDVSASLVEPFVSANGGGMAVDWLNSIADKMREFENLEGPVKGTALALGGIVGASSLAAGGFLALAPRIVETQAAFKTLAGQGGLVGKTAQAIGGLGPVLGAAAVAWLAFESANILANKATEASIPSVEKINSELAEMAKKGGELTGAFGGSNAFMDWMGHSQSVKDMGDALEVIGRHAEGGTTGWAKFREAITPGRQELERATDGVKAYDEGLASLVNDGKLEQAQGAFKNIAKSIPEGMPQSEVMERFSDYREALQGVANDLDVTSLSEKDYYEWMRGNVPAAIQEAAAAQEQAANGYKGMSEAAVAAQEHLAEVREGLINSANGFVDFTAKAKESKTTLQEWITDMEKQVEAQAQWMDNLAKLAQRGAPQELLDQLMAMGPEGARMVKQLADGSDEDMQRVIDVFKESKRNVNEFANSVAGLPPIDLDADASKLKSQVSDAKDRLQELEKLPTTPEVDAQITLLKEKIKEGENKLDALDKKKAKPEISADTAEAKKQIREAVKKMEEADGKEANMFVKIWRTITGPNESGAAKKSGKGRKGVEKRAKMLKDPFAYATGGPISGPGSGTSDSIPAWLSNGEHVWTAEEVRKAGGHSAIEALRQAAKSGMLGFAKGGAVGAAERRVDSANVALKGARRRKQDARSKAAKAAATRAVRAAEDELDAARKSLKAAKSKASADSKAAREAERRAKEAKREADRKAKEAKRIAEQKAKEERERKARVGELRSDLRVDIRRGDIRDQVTSGLSGGYSAVDRMLGLGKNADLSKASRSRANSSARRFEANLKSLYAQAERIDERLKKAQDKAQELKGIKDSVVNSLLGGRDLDVGTTSTMVNGQWQTSSNLGQAAKGLRMDVGAMKAFAGKLKKLVELGIPGSIVQEIAQAGVAEGSNMADSFIDATAAERKSYLGAWSDYEKYAGQAGQYVTEGFHKGGSAAADGVVKGLEGKQKNVEKAIANLAKAMESTFKQVLGIHSPSRVMSELGGFTAEGLVQGMLGGVADVQSAAAALGSAAIPGISTDMAFDVSANPVVADDEGMAGLAMQDMSNTTLEAMQAMGLAVSDGFAGMLANTQAAQAQMLLDTQLNQTGMLTATQASNLGQLTDTQTQQAAMLLNTQTQNAAMLLDTQTQQEAMRANVLAKQTGQKTAATEQQELMRLMLIDKQSQMKTRSAEDFESLKNTTGSKFGTMRSETDTTMSNLHKDYSGRLTDLKGLNKTGFESIVSTSNKNMEAVRDGIDGQMAAAKPEMGNRLNSLIGVLSKFTASVNKAFGDVGVELKAPQTLKFATGGVMPGYSPGADIHRFVSPTAGELHLSGGEAIMRPEWTRAMGGEAGVKAQNDAARQGRFDDLLHMQESGHFATGGVYGRVPGVNAFADSGVWRNLWAITKAKFPNATLNSAYRGGSITASGNRSHHSRGNAIDVNPSMDIFNFWRNKYGANLAELIYSPAGNKQIKNGRNYTYTGAVKSMHYNHVHIAALRALSDAMAGGLPGMGGEMSHPFLDRAKIKPGDDLAKSYKRAAEKLTAQIYGDFSGRLPQGEFGQLGKGIMSQVSEGLVKKATEYGKNAGTADFSNVAAGPVKTMARDMLKQMGWEDQFGDLNWLLTRESGWNPRAQNPTSTAYGLFQFLNSTWGTVGGSKTSDPKKQLEYGLKYIQQRYGDVRGARSFWERNHWYEDGTNSAKKGWAVVGENGPELVKLNGGETVKNGAQTRKLLAENRTFIPNQKSGFDASALTDAVSNALSSGGVSSESLAAAFDGVRMTFQADGQQFTGAVSAVVGSGYDESRSRLAKASQKIGAR